MSRDSRVLEQTTDILWACYMQEEPRVTSNIDIFVIVINFNTIISENCISLEIAGLSCTAKAIVSM